MSFCRAALMAFAFAVCNLHDAPLRAGVREQQQALTDALEQGRSHEGELQG